MKAASPREFGIDQQRAISHLAAGLSRLWTLPGTVGLSDIELAEPGGKVECAAGERLGGEGVGRSAGDNVVTGRRERHERFSNVRSKNLDHISAHNRFFF